MSSCVVHNSVEKRWTNYPRGFGTVDFARSYFDFDESQRPDALYEC